MTSSETVCTPDTPAPASAETALRLKNVSKTYSVSQGLFSASRPLVALNGVSLSIQRGETLGLVGESGCGKSTLAKILMGLEKPTGGEVEIFGVPFADHGRKWLARRLQMIFQDPFSSLNPRQSVREIVSLPLRIHRVGIPNERDAKVAEMLDLVGLPRRLIDASPSQMSGGQRQRVAIARALVMRPDIVVCDEPTSALDVSVQSQILNLLMDLRRELDLTYVFISHDLSVVEHIASRIAVMYLGDIVEMATPDRIFGAPEHPYTAALLSSVLTPDPRQNVPEVAIGGTFPSPLERPSGCAFHPRCPRADLICRREAPSPTSIGGGIVCCHVPLSVSEAPA